jgi:diguanylate cyclase
LFRKYILQDEQSLDEMRTALSEIVVGLQKHVRTVGGGLAQYTETLSRFATLLGGESSVDARDVGEVLEQTKATHASHMRLNDSLAAVSAEVEALRRELRQVREESLVDALTGVGNRRAFDREIERQMAELVSGGTPLSVLIGDIDHFKRFNDSYGHLTGDRVIRFVARTLQKCVAQAGSVMRYGGEEFAVLLPGTGLSAAQDLAEVIRGTVSAGVLQDSNAGKSYGRVTISIGVAVCRRGEEVADLIARADKALYNAKQAGRNRVMVGR